MLASPAMRSSAYMQLAAPSKLHASVSPCIRPNSSRSGILCRAASGSRTDTLRQLFKSRDVLLAPACHDGLSARLIEDAGFKVAFMSGFCTSAARLGAPDTGLISYAEMVDQGRYVVEATRSIPIIGDGDTGYGNAVNVKRTVRGYAQAGLSGVLIEDQVAPKSCGHVKGKKVVSRDEAVARIRAAVDAREEGSDILIVARTDARQAQSMEEALWRVEAFAKAGADVLFIDALESEQEMAAFCAVAPHVPKMASMLEGGGKTPILTPDQLHKMGFKLVAYPLSLLGVSIKAMQQALQGLKFGRVPPAEAIGSFADVQRAVGFEEYFSEAARYAPAEPSAWPTHNSGAGAAAAAPNARKADEQAHTTASAKHDSAASPAAAEARRTSLDGNFQTSSSGAPATNSSYPRPSAAYARESLYGDKCPPSAQASPPPASNSDVSTAGGTPASSSSNSGSSGGSSSSSGSSGASGAGHGTSSGADSPGSRFSERFQDMKTKVIDAADIEADSGAQVVPPPRPAYAGAEGDPAFRRNRTLRLCIRDLNSGMVKLETRVPAGFLTGLSAMVPQVQGINLDALIEKAIRESTEPGKPLYSTIAGSDSIMIFLE